MPMTRDERGVTITLTDDEYSLLTLALGYAAGASVVKDDGDRFPDRLARRGGRLFWSAMRLANSVHEGDPNWTPYEIPTEVTP